MDCKRLVSRWRLLISESWGTGGALTDRRREILDLATQTSLTPHVIEKDYVLGWMLAGIYAHEKLGNTSIFKGGTCLKNCFFETYRFSADLDFTLRNGAHLDETFLKRVFAKSAHGFMMRRVSKSPGAGDVLLMAVRAEDGNPRSYRVDSFFGASPTQIGFSPGHPIELTPSGPQSILPTSRSTGIVTQRTSTRRRSRASSGGAIDVFRCPVCRKGFDRKSYDASLRPHKKLGRLSVLRLIRADKILGLAKRICRLRSVG